MKRVSISIALAVIVTCVVASAGDAIPIPTTLVRASIDCWQYGIPTTTITAGDPFQVRGAGFAGSLPVSICFSGDLCLHSDVDASGHFTQNRLVRTPGRYLVTVRQARSGDTQNWILRATLQVQVTR